MLGSGGWAKAPAVQAVLQAVNGRWLGRPAIARETGLPYNSVKAYVAALTREGKLIRRTIEIPNARWQPFRREYRLKGT